MSNDYPPGSTAKWLEMVAPVPGNADGVDIVCSAWKHAAVCCDRQHAGKASRTLLNKWYKLILDRMVGSHHLHKKVAIVGAGNLESDNAFVQPMSTALQSRMKHLNLTLSNPEWMEWALGAGIDYRITAWINFKPTALYTFRPDHTDHTYASPRTWEFAHRTLQVCQVGDPDLFPMLAGDISEGQAAEFLEFIKIESQLPKMASIMADPEHTVVPNEPSVLFLLCGAIASQSTKENLENVVKYVMRLPAEFQVVCLREVIKRNTGLMAHPAIQKWVASTASKLF